MASSAGSRSGKLEEAQASARSCARRPDFLPCDGGQSACTTHSHGKCFKLHWCCHLDWCHCKYVYQPMTSVCLLPSSSVPSCPSDYTSSYNLSILLSERFLRTAPYLIAPLRKPSPTLCNMFGDDDENDDDSIRRKDGQRCCPQRWLLSSPSKSMTSSMPNKAEPPPVPKHLQPIQTEQQCLDRQTRGQETHHLASPSSSEDSGINMRISTKSCDKEEEVEEEEDEEELGRHYHEEEFSLLAPSRSLMEIIEQIKTTI
ncbi:UPF0524 protein C3orf70 homolog A-like [Lampris incognitus]|uniref:UPF0524 protein C3orf70 homolog A-like n=1 Tax=Lampris incognitus TaxID=2546036 RepID=UPI0024B5CE37|nr:UPF0524 protein C3orf70 homolog A-like [Lampris incognitus]